MNPSELEYLASLLGVHRPEVTKLLLMARRNPSMSEFVLRRFQIMLSREGHDLAAPSPFAPFPDQSSLAGPGLDIGRVHQTGDKIFLRPKDIKKGVLILGTNQSGKTNFGYWLAEMIEKQL